MELSKSQTNVLHAIKNKENVLVTGAAGCGKTFLINHILKVYCEEKIGITAMTGVAATLYEEGKTLHSWGGIGLAKGSEEDILRNVRKNKKARANWTDSRMLIIDEVSMMTLELFEKLDYVARKLRKSENFYGGLQLILCGDFCQLPPVGSTMYCFESELFMTNIDCYLLEENFRQQSDNEFQNLLNEMRYGFLSKENNLKLKSRIVSEIPSNEHGIIPTQVFPKNVEVDSINEEEYSKLNNTEHSYECTTKVMDNENTIVLKETHVLFQKACEFMDKTSLLQKELKLCLGAQVMLVVNYDMDLKLANGTRGVVSGFNEIAPFYPIVTFKNGTKQTISSFPVTHDLGYATITRSQVPLKLAWAITVHKSQGMTLDYIISDLRNVFLPSQIYVTLSRVRSLDGLYLQGINLTRIKCDQKVKKFYDELKNGTYKKQKKNAFSEMMKKQQSNNIKSECLI